MKDIQVSTRYGVGVATIAHAAGCYGQPVVLVSGQVYGPIEIGAVSLPTYGADEADVAQMHRAMTEAGYEVYA